MLFENFQLLRRYGIRPACLNSSLNTSGQIVVLFSHAKQSVELCGR